MVVYRTLGWKEFWAAAAHAARASGAVLFVIGAAGAFGWLIAYMQIPSTAAEFLQSVTSERHIALLLMLVLLLILGTFLDLAPMIIIVTPILLPVAKSYGIEPMHFGVIMVLAAVWANDATDWFGVVRWLRNRWDHYHRSDAIDLAVLLRGFGRVVAGDLRPSSLADIAGNLALAANA